MKRLLGSVVVVAAIVAMAAGCSDPSSSHAAGKPAPTAVNPTAKLTGVTLTMWAAQASATEADSVIAAFQQTTGATINKVVVPDPYESNVQTKLASGDKPDLMFWQPTESALTSIRAKDTLQVLDGQPWTSQLLSSLSTIGVLDNTRYAAPLGVPSVIGVYYNKQVFQKAGIAAPPANFDEMLADAKKIKSAGVSPFYEVGKDMWPLQWAIQVQLADLTKSGTFWPKLNQNQAKWTDPAIVAAITKYKTGIIDAGLTNPDYKTGTFVDQGKQLYDGQAGMAIQLNALLGEITAAHPNKADVDQRIGFFPISPSGNTGTYVVDQTQGFVAPKTGDTQREAAARQFIAFWLGPQYQSYLNSSGQLPVINGAQPPANATQAAIDSAKSLDNAVPAFQMVALDSPDMHIDLADMLYGKKTPEQVAEACENQFVQVAKAQGAPGF